MKKQNNFIYKYVSYDDAIKTLKNGSVVLNNPLNYNDPFDCIIDFSKGDENNTIQLLVEVAFVKEIINLFNNKQFRFKWYQKPIIWLDRVMLNLFVKMTRKQRFYSSNPIFRLMISYMLKKAKDCDIDINQSIEKAKKDFLDDILPKLKEMRSNALVSCFSKRNDSILMWGHYADKHKGVCIAFERPDKEFYDVKYRKNRTKFPLFYLASVVSSYLLVDEEPFVEDEYVIKRGLQPFLIKSIDWSYEKEVRCLFSSTNCEKFINIGDNKYLYKMPTCIKEIYLGCKCENYNEIIEYCFNNNIKVYKFSQSKNKYTLMRYEIKQGVKDE